jgi:hypothetical protein
MREFRVHWDRLEQRWHVGVYLDTVMQELRHFSSTDEMVTFMEGYIERDDYVTQRQLTHGRSPFRSSL